MKTYFKMNKLITCIIIIIISFAISEADENKIIENIKRNLFIESFHLKGTLRLKLDTSKSVGVVPIDIFYNVKNEYPQVKYNVNGTVLTVDYNKSMPLYSFSDSSIIKSDSIFNTRMKWDDLCFSYLWWPNPKIINEEKKLNRSCWVLEIPSPENLDHIYLWVDKETFFPIESQLFKENHKIKTTRIKRLKKVNDIWLPKHFEIFHHDNNEKSQLWIDQFYNL